MSSIFNKQSLETIDKIRGGILKAAIWVLIGGVVAGAGAILVSDTSSGEIVAKFMGTMFIVGLMMMICVNNFRRIACEDAAIQSFALVGVVSNVVWAVLWTLIVWDPELACTKGTFVSCNMSILVKFATAFSYLSALGLIGSNVLAIYEGEKKGLIRPLKITAVICATYEMLYYTVITFSGTGYESYGNDKLAMLAGFVGFVWFWIVIAALIISRSEKRKLGDGKKVVVKEEPVEKKPKTDDELRAEIEEQVRREMIEKEVRERLEKK